MIEQLDENERADALDALGEWDFDDARDAITRRFIFPDFSAAFAFMTRVASRTITPNGQMSGTAWIFC